MTDLFLMTHDETQSVLDGAREFLCYKDHKSIDPYDAKLAVLLGKAMIERLFPKLKPRLKKPLTLILLNRYDITKVYDKNPKSVPLKEYDSIEALAEDWIID